MIVVGPAAWLETETGVEGWGQGIADRQGSQAWSSRQRSLRRVSCTPSLSGATDPASGSWCRTVAVAVVGREEVRLRAGIEGCLAQSRRTPSFRMQETK